MKKKKVRKAPWFLGAKPKPIAKKPTGRKGSIWERWTPSEPRPGVEE